MEKKRSEPQPHHRPSPQWVILVRARVRLSGEAIFPAQTHSGPVHFISFHFHFNTTIVKQLIEHGEMVELHRRLFTVSCLLGVAPHIRKLAGTDRTP